LLVLLVLLIAARCISAARTEEGLSKSNTEGCRVAPALEYRNFTSAVIRLEAGVVEGNPMSDPLTLSNKLDHIAGQLRSLAERLEQGFPPLDAAPCSRLMLRKSRTLGNRHQGLLNRQLPDVIG
jgi:hypothetical protein